jgi:hypothetical protein
MAIGLVDDIVAVAQTESFDFTQGYQASFARAERGPRYERILEAAVHATGLPFSTEAAIRESEFQALPAKTPDILFPAPVLAFLPPCCLPRDHVCFGPADDGLVPVCISWIDSKGLYLSLPLISASREAFADALIGAGVPSDDAKAAVSSLSLPRPPLFLQAADYTKLFGVGILLCWHGVAPSARPSLPPGVIALDSVPPLAPFTPQEPPPPSPRLSALLAEARRRPPGGAGLRERFTTLGMEEQTEF